MMEKRQLFIERVEEEITEKIKKSEVKNNEVVKIVEEMKKAEVKILKNNEWQIEIELVLKKRKVYILKDKGLRLEIIQLYYDMPIAEYEEQLKTVKLVTRNY